MNKFYWGVGIVTVWTFVGIGIAIVGFNCYLLIDGWIWAYKHRLWCKQPPPKVTQESGAE